MHRHSAAASILAFAGSVGLAHAVVLPLRVTVENLAPANSVSFAPLRFGFGNGSFDTFNEGQAAFLLGQPTIAQAPIVTIAEGGSGSTWFPAFASAEPNSNRDSVTGPTGPFTPGSSNSAVFSIDTANRFFTFGSMAVPSNDYFVGNDSPTRYPVFDANGTLILTSILQEARDIWDAGSETENPANAAFLVNGNNDLRKDENGVVTHDFAGLSIFNGQTTAAGYVFDSTSLSADTDVFRVSFEVVPEPTITGFISLVGLALRRRCPA
jgi:hypothetical protein